jgi:hypothetical protein
VKHSASLLLLGTSLFVGAQVLLPPIPLKLSIENSTLTIHRAECYPSADVIDLRIFNPAINPFEGKIYLVLAATDHHEEVMQSIVLGSRREARVTFDFGKGICNHAHELQIRSVPSRRG